MPEKTKPVRAYETDKEFIEAVIDSDDNEFKTSAEVIRFLVDKVYGADTRTKVTEARRAARKSVSSLLSGDGETSGEEASAA
mgnify:CR=1 FL=1